MGRKFAANLIATGAVKKARTGGSLIIALSGELGSGKTTFVQGLAEGFGIKQRIISPTFILVRRYEIGISNQELSVKSFYHIDLYRLETSPEAEVRNLGMDDIWRNSENIVVIEWAERIKNIVPKGAIWINFEHLREESRRITVK